MNWFNGFRRFVFFLIVTSKGTREYMEKYAETIKRVSGTFGPTPTYSGEALEKIVKTMEAEIPLTGQLKNFNQNLRQIFKTVRWQTGDNEEIDCWREWPNFLMKLTTDSLLQFE